MIECQHGRCHGVEDAVGGDRLRDDKMFAVHLIVQVSVCNLRILCKTSLCKYCTNSDDAMIAGCGGYQRGRMLQVAPKWCNKAVQGSAIGIVGGRLAPADRRAFYVNDYFVALLDYFAFLFNLYLKLVGTAIDVGEHFFATAIK